MYPMIRIKNPDFLKENNIPQTPNWDHMDDATFNGIAEKVYIYIAQLAGVDVDGDCPIAVLLANRKKEIPPSFDAVPIEPWDDDTTDEEIAMYEERALKALTFNIHVASDALYDFMRMKQVREMQKKDRESCETTKQGKRNE